MIHQYAFHAMGCEMQALLDSPGADAADQLAHVSQWFEAWEQRFSRFRDESELSRLNRSRGTWITVSDDLWQALETAFAAAQQTDGLVTPTMLPSLEALGYDQTFAAIGQHDERTARAVAEPLPVLHSWREIERDQRTHAVRLPAPVRLDLGGSAKGWAADRAAELLKRYGPALVDAGGDIAVSGPLADGSAWPIGVADPAHPDADLAVLLLHRGGVATSGRDYRRWQRAGVWQHHILDPRTGQPATTDVLSATVIGPSAREAEAAAKVALILGSRDGLAWLEARPALAGLLVLEDGAIAHSERLREYVV